MSSTDVSPSDTSTTPTTVFGSSWTGSASAGGGAGTSPFTATLVLAIIFSLAAAFAVGIAMIISWSAWKRRRRSFYGSGADYEREREADLVEHWVEWRRRLRGEERASREMGLAFGKEPELTEVTVDGIGKGWDEKREEEKVPLSLVTQHSIKNNETVAMVSYLILLPTQDSRPTPEHNASEGGGSSSEENSLISWRSDEGLLPEMVLGYETVLVVDGDGGSVKEGEGQWWEGKSSK